MVYANVTNRRGGSEIIIEEGTMVRERQVILRLVDPKQLQVKAHLSKSHVALVKKGMAATILIDAFPERQLTGTVARVGAYPLPRVAFASDVRAYETTIRIHDPSTDLRVGLTAEVRIHLQGGPDAKAGPQHRKQPVR